MGEIAVHDYRIGDVPNRQRDVPFTVGLFCIADDDAHCHQLMPPGTIDKVDGRKTFDADCWKDVVETTIALAGWAKREMRRERNRRRRRSKGVEVSAAGTWQRQQG